MDELKIKQEIIIKLLIEKLYDGLEVESGKVVYDRFNLTNKEIKFLLKEYDEKRFNTYCEMLIESAKKED